MLRGFGFASSEVSGDALPPTEAIFPDFRQIEGHIPIMAKGAITITFAVDR
jgi:hypothetical protein